MAHVTLGTALQTEIERRDLRQREAAQQLGVSQQALSRWLAGHDHPAPENLPRIARFLHVPLAEVREMRDTPRRRTSNARIDQLEAAVSSLRTEVETLRRLIAEALSR